MSGDALNTGLSSAQLTEPSNAQKLQKIHVMIEAHLEKVISDFRTSGNFPEFIIIQVPPYSSYQRSIRMRIAERILKEKTELYNLPPISIRTNTLQGDKQVEEWSVVFDEPVGQAEADTPVPSKTDETEIPDSIKEKRAAGQ